MWRKTNLYAVRWFHLWVITLPNTEVKKCVRVCPCARVHVCICPLLVKKHCSHKQLIEFRHVISDLFWTVDGTASISSVSFHHRKPLERYLPVNKNGWNSHFYMFKEYMFICMALCLKCHTNSAFHTIQHVVFSEQAGADWESLLSLCCCLSCFPTGWLSNSALQGICFPELERGRKEN